MEALWNLEDKWKISTQQAFLLLVSAAFAVIGLCMAATVLLKKAQRKQEQQLVMSSQREAVAGQPKWSEPSCGWGSITRALVSSVRWSRRSKWEERRGGSWRATPLPLPLLDKRVEVEVGWRSHNSDSPVWQRPILMGEKCELPRFSGLILYDERGRPLCDSHKEIRNQENTGGVGRTTLRDLL
ncbi:uncharacterized protein [Pyrus communis]|uniref:uncharacterized protein n=1 Tax=Pyrus communis TaxID=23211 RepID=UPI0035C1FCD8